MNLPDDGSNPSPDPRRLENTPYAGHPLPKGEGGISDFGPPVSSQRYG
jgi:hypothetical protein